MKSGVITSGSAEIFYEIFGDLNRRIPIVFLHGNGEDSGIFKNQIPVFEKGFPLIAIDSRAHGRSTCGEDGLSLDMMADDILTVLDALGVPEAHFLGFSDGGNIALLIAMKSPKTVRSMVLVGANLFPGGMKIAVLFPILLQYAALKFGSLFSKKMHWKSKVVGLMVHEPRISCEQLRKIDLPVLVMAGQRDMIKTEHITMIAENLPNSKLSIVSGGDHFILAKMPDVCNAEIMLFFNEIEQSGIPKGKVPFGRGFRG